MPCARAVDARAQLTAHEIALRIRSGAAVGHLVEQAVFLARSIRAHRSIFLADLSFAEVIETKVGNDAVNPGVEGTLEAEAAHVLIGLQERVLENILRVVFRPSEMQRQAQHRLVVVANEFLEGSVVSPLRLADQHRVVDAVSLPSHVAP